MWNPSGSFFSVRQLLTPSANVGRRVSFIIKKV